jgi:hypothetical protein
LLSVSFELVVNEQPGREHFILFCASPVVSVTISTRSQHITSGGGAASVLARADARAVVVLLVAASVAAGIFAVIVIIAAVAAAAVVVVVVVGGIVFDIAVLVVGLDAAADTAPLAAATTLDDADVVCLAAAASVFVALLTAFFAGLTALGAVLTSAFTSVASIGLVAATAAVGAADTGRERFFDGAASAARSSFVILTTCTAVVDAALAAVAAVFVLACVDVAFATTDVAGLAFFGGRPRGLGFVAISVALLGTDAFVFDVVSAFVAGVASVAGAVVVTGTVTSAATSVGCVLVRDCVCDVMFITALAAALSSLSSSSSSSSSSRRTRLRTARRARCCESGASLGVADCGI